MNMPEGSDRDFASSSSRSSVMADKGEDFVEIEAGIDEELPFN